MWASERLSKQLACTLNCGPSAEFRKEDEKMPSLQSTRAWTLAGVLALAFWSAPAAARDYYGAIAFSQSGGGDGYSSDYSTQGGAEAKALQECGGGCKVVIWFKNACGALAVGQGNGYGTGWAASSGQAQTIAVTECSKNTTNCGIKRWQCTTR
jgi:hypothetical protein